MQGSGPACAASSRSCRCSTPARTCSSRPGIAEQGDATRRLHAAAWARSRRTALARRCLSRAMKTIALGDLTLRRTGRRRRAGGRAAARLPRFARAVAQSGAGAGRCRLSSDRAGSARLRRLVEARRGGEVRRARSRRRRARHSRLGRRATGPRRRPRLGCGAGVGDGRVRARPCRPPRRAVGRPSVIVRERRIRATAEVVVHACSSSSRGSPSSGCRPTTSRTCVPGRTTPTWTRLRSTWLVPGALTAALELVSRQRAPADLDRAAAGVPAGAGADDGRVELR